MDPIIWALLLVALGVLLVALEIFIPSGGLLSVLAGAAFLAAIVVGYTVGPGAGTGILALTAVVVPLLISAAIRWWPHTPLGRMVLINIPKNEREVLPETEAYRWRETMLGRCGRAKTKMLPAGVIRIDGRSYDAISAGMPIEAGQPVKVVAIRTNRLVVRPVEEQELQRATVAEATDEQELLARPLDDLGLDPLDDPLS